MPKFRSLSEAIRFQILQVSPPIEVPITSPLSVQLGAAVPLASEFTLQDNVFRWGFSTWGVEDITTDYSPVL